MNRDVSWLQFNRRVLEEAQDLTTPLLERGKFLGIVSSNLDEFMSVRVASIVDQIRAGYTKADLTGFTPRVLLRTILQQVRELAASQMTVYRQFTKELANEGLVLLEQYEELNLTQQRAMNEYYNDIVAPVLTPMAVDQSRPFPLVHHSGLYLAVVLQKETGSQSQWYFAIVHVPALLPRLMLLPKRRNSNKTEYVFIETIMKQHIHSLFASYTVRSVSVFRLTRNADLTLDEEGSDDLLVAIEKELHKRKWGNPIRLEVEQHMHPHALHVLQAEFNITEHTFSIEGPLDLTYLIPFFNTLQNYDRLRYPTIEPIVPQRVLASYKEEGHLFSLIAKQDVLLHHPYESFDPVTEFVLQAAHDPHVLAIKMTLYRVSGHSLLVQSLGAAAQQGKQVTVIVELKARFDEERNIAWARTLEQAGCHVVYGLVGLKTHAKVLLVVRQEPQGLRRYVHVGTGNYNDTTAKLYTDIGLFTSHPSIGEDATALFNEMTGYSAPRHWKAFSVAPQDLRDQVIALIRQETAHARAGKRARIIAKMNGLSHKEIIDELYVASQAGVIVDLIVRGVCCLRPGVPELSERIQVLSIVDRFLEHSRVYYFENAGKPKIYVSSADWLTRNLTRRIEVMCPVYDEAIRQSLIRILHTYLQDNVKARKLLPTGEYVRVKNDHQPPFRVQFASIHVNDWKME